MIKKIDIHYTYEEKNYPGVPHMETTVFFKNGKMARILLIVNSKRLLVCCYPAISKGEKRKYLEENELKEIGEYYLNTTNQFRLRHLVSPYDIQTMYL